MRNYDRLAFQLMLGVSIVALGGCTENDNQTASQGHSGIVCQYVMDEDTAQLKSESEADLLESAKGGNTDAQYIAGYTNYTTFGMAQDCKE